MVAELCGFAESHRAATGDLMGYSLSGEWCRVPDYTGSLDAMAEAEKTLNESHRAKMVAHLHYLSLNRPMFSVYFVDALDRAISFILTKQEERA